MWQRVFMELSRDSEFAQRVYLDSTIVRAHQHAAGAVKKRRASLGAFARRIEHQGPCVGGKRSNYAALATEISLVA